MTKREAMFYSKMGDTFHCELCPHACRLREGQAGKCRGRKVIEGKLMAENYAQAVSVALDPIEKKPLYHYHPGSLIISLGPNSCNLNCAFCQNWQISQVACPTRQISIEELAELCRKQNIPQVAFTYSEPLMWYEYIYDFAHYAPDVKIVLVTNAYLQTAPWTAILPSISAMNIDLKSIRDDFYRKVCGGGVETVKNNIITAYNAKIHIEITNLLIPGMNTAETDIAELSQFIASISGEIPLHISAYHPEFKLNIPATTPEEVEQACIIASRYLKYVYAGNVHSQRFGRKS